MRRVVLSATLVMLVGGALVSRPACASTGFGFWNWYLLPSAGSLPGMYGTYWRTDLNIVNPYQFKSITVTAMLLKELVDNSAAPRKTYTVGPGAELVVADVVKSEFGVEGKGSLLLWTADGSYFTASARTYTGSPGTFGQGINAQGWVSTGRDRAFIAGLRNGGGFRTNLGAVNASDIPITLVAEVVDATGTARGSRTFSLLPWSTEQISVDSFAGQVAQGYVRWTCSTTSSDAQWVAYASVVDNTSGDAVYLEERPDDVATMYEPAYDLSGRWEGTILINGYGSEAVTVNVYQDAAMVWAYVYNSATGCREMYLDGYETGGTITFTGTPYLYDFRGDDLWGTATAVSSTAISGAFMGTGFYASGGTFALAKAASFVAIVPGATEDEITPSSPRGPRRGRHTP